MTPQERQMVDDLFDRLAKMESAPRDPDATAAMAQGLRAAPNAVYALVQTVLVQDEALKQAHHRIEELEAATAPDQHPAGGGFLDSMRDAVFGQNPSRGSVPNVPPPPTPSRPVWNSGQVLQQSQQYPEQHYNEAPYGQGQQPYRQGQSFGQGQPYGSPQQSPMGGGGSFLGTAAAAAAGAVGGSLLLNSFRGMMGGSRQAFGDMAGTGNRSPWSDQSNSSLARDAGVNDVGSRDLAAQDRAQDLAQDREDDDLAAQDRAQDLAQDHDDMDLDSDDFDDSDNA
jgi:uncharacterized protein